MQIQIWKGRAANDYKIEFALTSAKDNEYIADNELMNLHEKAADVGQQLFIFITDKTLSDHLARSFD